MNKKVLVVVGPTAVGKSDLAVQLARKITEEALGGFSLAEVISADSRQVYTGLDIGTGKITKKEMRGIPHHLLDVITPKKAYSVADYVKDAEKAMEKIIAQNKLPIICGGTGFYIQALIDGIILPEVPPDKKLRADLEKKTTTELMRILTKLDPVRAKKIDTKNTHRIIRAIEIATALGKVPKLKKSTSKYALLFIGLTIPKEELVKKIRTRLEKRIKKGMIVEVLKLHADGLSWKRLNALGLEYRYVALYLQNKMTLSEMKEKLATEIWQYAKRQMTWFKRDARITWFLPSEIEKIEAKVVNFLK